MYINFRGWAIDHAKSSEKKIVKKMYYRVCLEYSDSKWGLIVRGSQRTEEEHLWWFEGDVVIMQSTNLWDKNRNKIWEGDIVKHKDGRVEQVLFNFNSFNGLYTDSDTLLEVIGNVCENPELLKD